MKMSYVMLASNHDTFGELNLIPVFAAQNSIFGFRELTNYI